MKRIYSFVLTLVMLMASVIPAYAGEGSMVTKSLFIETMKNTIDKVNTEMYGKGYSKQYEEAVDKFLKNLSDGSKITLDVTNVYNFDDDITKVAVNIVYNDDGQSIKIDMVPSADDSDYIDESRGSIYIDDEMILVDIPSAYESKLVYNFKGNEQDIINGFDMRHLQYSNIKKYINLFLDLETSGKLDKIVKDYKDNFLLYLSNADFTQIDNTITVTVNANLVKEYFGQLSTKIASDKNLKQIYDSLGLKMTYAEFANEISEMFNYMIEGINDDFQIKYFGIIENNVFVKNKLSFYADEYNSGFINIEFNDPKNGLLSSSIITLSDNVDNTTINFDLKDNKVGKVLNFKVFSNTELVSEGVYNYSIDGLKVVSNCEITTYTEPRFFATEEPVKEEPMEYNQWLKVQKESIEESVNRYRGNLSDAKSEKVRVENAVTNNEVVNIPYGSDFWNSEFRWEIEYNYYYDPSEIVDENGVIISPQKYLEILDLYINDCQYFFDRYTTEATEFDNLNHKEEYQLYLDDIEWFYDFYLEEYNRYVEYLNGDQKYDVTKYIMSAEQRITENRLTASQMQEIYLNDVLQTGSSTGIIIETSTEENVVDSNGAASLTEFLFGTN